VKIAHKMIGTMLIFGVAACFGCAAQAADSPANGSELPAKSSAASALNLVPEDALAVVVFNRLDKVDEQIGKLAKETQFPTPALLPMLKMVTGIQEGLNEHGSAVLALMPAEEVDAAPIAVVFIPVSDYKKFIGPLKPDDASAEIAEVTISGMPHAIAHKEDFAVVVGKQNKDTLKKVLSSSKSIVPVIGSLGDWVGSETISFVAMPTGVKRGIGVARKAIAQIKDTFSKANDPSTKMMAGNLAIYENFLEGADKEISQFAIGWHVDNDGGLHIDSRTTFLHGGSWASARPEAPAGARLACLPGGPFMLAFDGAMPKGFSQGMLNMSVDMINNMSKAAGGKELTEEQSKQLNGVIEKSMKGLRSMAMVMGPPKPGQSMYSNMAAVMKVENARQYMADYQDSMEKMRGILQAAGVQFPFIQDVKKTKIGDVDGLELTMDMSAMFKEAMKAPGSKKMLEAMFGKDAKMLAYIAPIDDTTVAISYIDADQIARVKAACQNPQASLAADADIAQTAKLLPAGAQWVGYLSLKGGVDFVSGIAASMSGAVPGGVMPNIPAFPEAPPIGFAAERSSKGLDVKIVVPGDALKGVGTYIKKVSAQKAGPGPKAVPPRLEVPARAR
jgi:hypothetical protein